LVGPGGLLTGLMKSVLGTIAGHKRGTGFSRTAVNDQDGPKLRPNGRVTVTERSR
jgi:hypothetical protein